MRLYGTFQWNISNRRPCNYFYLDRTEHFSVFYDNYTNAGNWPINKALSLALVWGFGGILCFGQSAFLGLGPMHIPLQL